MASRIAIAAVVGLLLLATNLLAELPPGAYEELKKKATDVLNVKITKVEMKDNSGDLQDTIYTAEVVRVDRSKSGRKVGDSIQIASYRLRPGTPPLAGPKMPPLLKAGWQGTVYLGFAG